MKGEFWLDPPQTGSWNMAMDQAMLEYAAATQQVVLRIYQWSKPTISLGYFQDFDGLAEFPELKSLDCVRRVTGGGAILHDRELTYSIAIPADIHRKGHSEELYQAVHQAIIEWLRGLGLAANLWREVNQTRDGSYSNEASFLCFERRSEVDIVVDSRKIVGSAQRRTSAGLLQHGSLLVESSPWLPQLAGLYPETCGLPHVFPEMAVTAIELGGILKDALGVALGLEWLSGVAGEAVSERVRTMAKERFSSVGWTQFRRISSS